MPLFMWAVDVSAIVGMLLESGLMSRSNGETPYNRETGNNMTASSIALLKTESKCGSRKGKPLTRKEAKALKQHKAAMAGRDSKPSKHAGRLIVDHVIHHQSDLLIPVYESGPQHPYVQAIIDKAGPHPKMKDA